MTQPFQRLRRFLHELKRRNVYKVAVTYAAVAFVGFQAVNLLIPSTTLPSWADELILAFLIVGFPVAVVVAWAFEMTPEGMRRTTEAAPDDEAEAPSGGARSAYRLLVGLGLVAATAAGGWYLIGGGWDSEAGPGVDDPSIAVLPFDNLSGTEEAEPFVNGLHDDLLTRLSNVSALKVISRTSVLPFQDSELSLPAIADSLGVTWIVEGGVQQAGDQVQVNAQLIQAREDAHQWAETYRRELTTENLFAVQSELTKKIARSLETELTPDEEERVERQPTDDLEAYRLYVQGRSQLYRRTEGGVRQALGYFQSAIAEDSSFARAWAGLADGLRLAEHYGYGLTERDGVSAAEAARRALTLDSTLAEAHAAYGETVARGFEKLRRYRRAIDLNPSYPQAYHWLATHEVALGRLDSAVAHLERATELDPMAPIIRLALSGCYYLRGWRDDALREVLRVRELVPDLGVAHLGAGMLLSGVGRHDEALAALDRGFRVASEKSVYPSVFRGWQGIVHARLGNRAEAEEVAAGLASVPGGALKRSLISAALGEPEKAASVLTEAEPDEWDWLLAGIFRYDRSLTPIHDTPEYRSVLRELNVQLGLNADGSLPDSVDVLLGPPSDG